ncbi:U-box domain containing protein [Entamoeba histolytica HM-1:IMSS-B]|uniref:RING-type E3 ubiquitin transferase n=5 Tax=Entamoeba histolytica TaxID=5759 RepID=C4M3H2_ENTH1|nr:hypothetical protein EHI_138180 [Entamoeba histolytica HM-1:IMSS]EMH73490.1 U-box domain containing protein [Entamoeba histolytica HM-1:IMSS-B]EMS17043.1 ubiquitination factor E4, putative [Entamoeba histolytica HM-3:IMSS]ENY61937.1 ubiquitination factor E4, putative [Entamoeba histolytica HM-1:IMSS-A]GAT95868.1 hypothetical protein CL6EHI_138180 [Entamoeba histolytica]EAL49755.2 hypothetical protein EHI_138180 [Entamoeba histolytica HM-1:IMSS]|eukprot:XP_655141.2 hypothetical protein EHI_138180 [Entamoeba histolytica HM-1:IMSS]
MDVNEIRRKRLEAFKNKTNKVESSNQIDKIQQESISQTSKLIEKKDKVDEESKKQKAYLYLIQKVFQCKMTDSSEYGDIDCKEFYSDHLVVDESFIEMIILHCLTNPKNLMSLSYLAECLNRLSDCVYLDKTLLEMIKKKIIDFMVIVLQCPDSFPSTESVYTMVWKLISGSQGKVIMKSIENHPDMMEITEIFYQVFLDQLGKIKLTSPEFFEFFSFIDNLLMNEAVALNIVCHDNFLPKEMTINQLSNTLLGRLLQIFFLEKLDGYGDPLKDDYLIVLQRLLPAGATGQKMIGEILCSLMKYEDSREQTFKWIDCFYTINKERMKIEYDKDSVFPDSLLLLFYYSLCYVFAKEIKKSTVNFNYFLNTNILELENTTLFQATPSEIKQLIFINGSYTNSLDLTHSTYPIQSDVKFPQIKVEAPSLSTLLFFTILKLSPVCLTQILHTNENIIRALSRARKEQNVYVCDYLKRILLSNNAQQFNADACYSMNNFCEYLVKFIFHCLPQNISPLLNQSNEIPLSLALLPEYIIGILSDFIHSESFITSNHLKSSMSLPEGFDVIICSFVSSQHICHNPYVRSELGEAITCAILNEKDVFNRPYKLLLNEFCKQHLIFSLLCFYVDCEKTGSHSQYYDKLNWRKMLQECFKTLWEFEDYQKKMIEIFESNNERIFPAFVQYIISDTNLILEDSLLKLSDIKIAEDKQKDKEKWNRLDKQTQNDIIRSMKENTSIVKNLFASTECTFKFLKLVLQKSQRPFLDKLVINDVAACFNYFLSCIVGERSSEFKVSNFEMYNFHPKEMLNSFFDIFLYLGQNDKFIQAIYEDTRSFKEKTFEAALVNVKYIHSKSEREMEEFQKLIDKIKNYSSHDIFAQVEEMVGMDLPEEYCDALLGTLMKDPVKLPNSHVIVDRTTIEKHLMNAKEDPFDRTPLELSMVIPMNDLKQKIMEYVMEKAKELKLK